MDLLAIGTGCPLCGSRDADPHLVRGGGPLITMGPATPPIVDQVVRCQQCGLGYRPARPGDAELSTLYRELDDETYESERRGRMATARRHLRIVQAYQGTGRLLDVGCASGMFLGAAAEAGWAVRGIEPSTAMTRRARNRLGGTVPIFEGMLHEWPGADEPLDVVTAWDVVEHASDPVGFIRRCRDAVRPGGWVFLNVPDISSVPARVFGRRWPLLLPHHLCYFDAGSLAHGVAESGLELVRLGRRAASFSLGYVLLRLAEHRVPGARLAGRLVPRGLQRSIIVPLPMGERYAVCRRPDPDRVSA